MPITIHERSSCAPHDDASGSMYDSEGRRCVTLSKQDKYFIIGASALCAFVLAVLAIVYVRQWRRSRSDAQSLAAENMASRVDAPLIITNTGYYPRSLSSPLQSVRLAPSPGSDHSHMPILTADGQLLSPWISSSEDDHRSARPLPVVPEGGEYEQPLIGIYPEQDIAQQGLYHQIMPNARKW